MTVPLVVVGDVLLDRDITGTAERLCPDAPVPVLSETGRTQRPGGAGLAALMLRHAGAEVRLVAAVGADEAGDTVRHLLRDAGVTLLPIPYDGPTTEKIRLRAGSHPLLRLDRGEAPGRYGDAGPAIRDALAGAGGVLVSDYGRGVTAVPTLRQHLIDAAGRVPLVWDPHPRGSAPVPGARLACPNRAEAALFAGGTDLWEAQAALLRERWGVDAVVVTLGAQGALLCAGDHPPRRMPAPVCVEGDPCGAGDRFASAALEALAAGRDVAGAVVGAVTAASRYVADGGPASLGPVSPQPAHRLHLVGTLSEGVG